LLENSGEVMAQKKESIKPRKAAADSGRRANGENGARPSMRSKLSRNESIQATDERMLRLWKKIYEDHHQAKRG
jgi:hypothetical protein